MHIPALWGLTEVMAKRLDQFMLLRTRATFKESDQISCGGQNISKLLQILVLAKSVPAWKRM